MKRILQIYLFAALATFILLALLKLASFPGITWGWVLLPIFGPLVLWLLVIGSFATVGLIWPTPKPRVPEYLRPGYAPPIQPLKEEKYKVETLRVERELTPEDMQSNPTAKALKEAYYRKAVALDLATLAHDTPGFIRWEKRENRITGELKILVKNEHA